MRKSILLLSSCLIAGPAFAQNVPDDTACCGGVDLPARITVTATGNELDITNSGQPVTIIGSGEITSIQGADLTRVLQRAPGVTITRNGGSGGFTGVRVRGAASEDLLVLIDGVRVADVAAPGGGFDFGNALAGNIERIELLRGPNSVIWGSDALAGVINLTTKMPDGIVASAEYGAQDTVYATLGGGIVSETTEAGLTGSFYRTDGISAASAGSERDGFEQWQLTGRGRQRLGTVLTLTLNGRYAEGDLGQDGFPPPSYVTFTDAADFQDTREWSGRAGAEADLGALFLNAGFAISDTKRVYTGESYGDFPYETQGRSERAELFGRYGFADSIRLDFGADREWTSFDDSGSKKRAAITSGHALLGWYGEFLSVAAGARYDDHSNFGDAWTLGANAAWAFAPDWRVRASYGEGFKAPSLYQSESTFYGNPDLRAETSKGYDLGIEHGLRDGPFFVALSAFRRDSRDLIDFVSCFSSSDPLCGDGRFGFYDNADRTRAEGFEVELGATLGEHLRAQAVYSHVETRDRSGGIYDGNRLARRPAHALTASLDWSGLHGLTIGGDVRLVGDSFDDRANLVSLDGYATADLRASLAINEFVEVFGRAENLFDVRYETAAGYNTGGAALYAGARLRL